METDILVLGSGIAGLTFALKVAEHNETLGKKIKIDVFSKSELDECSTKYAQGGISAVLDTVVDSFEEHINDTINCGGGLSNRIAVERVVKEAPKQIKKLIEWGTAFDKNENGAYDLAKEGGHSKHRILHSKDSTGLAIEKALLSRAKASPSIRLHYNHFAIELLIQNSECKGALIFDKQSQKLKRVNASYTLLATGGIGQVYEKTTNPEVSTGDGIAIALRAGATISGMEFVQFHPTALWSNDSPAFLISEAVRGFGGILKNVKGEEFCKQYDVRSSLAPRDIVARAIAFEMQSSKQPFVNLQVSHLDRDSFENNFPMISRKCKAEGLNLSTDSIPVVPAAHYLCGGIEVDENGLTSVSGLLACGECANTGLHGANRLASNSLLEGMAYAEFCFQYVVNTPKERATPTSKSRLFPFIPPGNLKELKAKLRHIMFVNAGIVKSKKGLNSAKKQILELEEETNSFETKTSVDCSTLEYVNMLAIARLIVQQALCRKENIGLHYLV